MAADRRSFTFLSSDTTMKYHTNENLNITISLYIKTVVLVSNVLMFCMDCEHYFSFF